MRRLYLSAALALTFALSLSAADWPRFRGPNGTGVAAGPLPPINPTAPLWKVEIPGKGAGSPIVVGGKVYLQTAADDGSKRSLLCLGAATGKTEWTAEVPGQKAPTHNLNTMASSTPASDGERIYCVWWDGKAVSVHAYDLAGKELWSQPLGSYQSQHGPGHSPAVYRGKVFVNFDQDGRAEVVALDAKTGAKVWAAPRKPGKQACYSTPSVLEQPGKPAAVVVVSSYAVDSYDPDTGKVNWHYTINWAPGATVLRAVGGPVFADGLVIGHFGQGGGKEQYMVAVRTDGTGDVTATARAWEVRHGVPYVPCVLARGDYLFWAYDTGGKLYCAEAKSGKPVWDEQVFKKDKGAVYASPVLVGDRMLVISAAGRVAVLKADKEFNEPTMTDLGEKVSASPAVADGRVYIRGEKHLFCFGPRMQ